MIAWIFEVFFLWLPLVGLVCLVPAFYFNDKHSFSASTFWFIIGAGLLTWAYWDTLKPIVDNYGMTCAAAVVIGGYLTSAMTTAFIYWLFFIFKARERFDSYMTKFKWSKDNESSTWTWTNKTEEAKKYLIVYDNNKLNDIYDDMCVRHLSVVNTLAIPRLDGEQSDETYAAAVAKALPPKFFVCKEAIIGAAIVWPVTLTWLLVSRVVKQLIERMVSMFSGTFNMISKRVFGEF